LDGEGISYKFKTWGDWKRIPNRGNAKAVFARQTDHFVEAMIGKSPLILGNGEGLKSQIIIEAAYASVKQDGKVNVSNTWD